MAPPSAKAGEPDSFPVGLHNAYWFAVFNALSYQIVLGSPMILYVKSLTPSATVLGIAAGMMPLLVIFQIPAASHIARIGYKRFFYAGWGTRVMFIFFMTLVPLTSAFLDATTRLGLLMFLLFGFNLSRGISSAAWLPWITALVPPAIRGKYLAREAACVHVASCATLLFAAGCLGRQPHSWQFAVVFLFSAMTGAISLVFMKKMPEAEPPEKLAAVSGPVPWRDIAMYPPFRKLLLMTVAWSVAYGGLNAFTVAYLKTQTVMSEGRILLVTALAYLGGLAGLTYFESRTDRLGSKPVLAFCLWAWMGIMGGWFMLGARAIPPYLLFLIILELFMGLAYALVNMNNTRLAMLIAPTMGRSHFFALYSVVTNLALGLAPVFWGLIIDAFGPRQFPWEGLELNRYSLFFLSVLGVFGLTLVLCHRLEEPKARNLEELIRELLLSPQRLWLRVWPRG
jgi:MFS family permease